MHGDETSVTLGSENARVLEEEKQLVTCLIDQLSADVRNLRTCAAEASSKDIILPGARRPGSQPGGEGARAEFDGAEAGGRTGTPSSTAAVVDAGGGAGLSGGLRTSNSRGAQDQTIGLPDADGRGGWRGWFRITVSYGVGGFSSGSPAHRCR